MVNKYQQFSKVEDVPGMTETFLPYRVEFGSIWWVRDPLWVEYARWYPEQKRKAHPGLCARNPSLGRTSSLEPIYLLIGTSKKRGRSFFVHGVSENKGTHFHLKKGASIPGIEFAPPHGHPQITRNTYKTSLSPSECSELRKRMKQL